ncbi:hypothetical protein [Sphingomonas sp. PAMC 26621]|uniref:hypothetical protein n=1 Tax=Sphingomonas sp. PAMC 26621 TaxID=1112213 RepID=UPI000289C030|nr:hypothetical protein [Sphingomonas sp. PAMC 26621]
MAVLVEINAYDPVAGAPVSLYASSHDDTDACHAPGPSVWWPALAKLPALRYDLFDGAFEGQITAPSSSLIMQTEPWPSFARYAFADARVRVTSGSPDNWTLRFDGRISSQPKIENGTAAVDFAVDDKWLDTALLTTYAGTSGAEGAATMKGQTKPLALGAPRYVPGKLIDSINNVFQISAYNAISSIDTALEKLNRFAPSVGDYASYAALIGAAIPAGRWATAKAVGMARFGAPPAGLISFLVGGDSAGQDGWARLPGQIIRRIALFSGGAGKIDDVSLDALDAARPYPISIYIEEQTTARQLIQSIAASVNAVAGVSWLGKLFVAPVAIGAANTTLAADGSALPPVSSVSQIDVAAPWQKISIGAERAWTVHALSDIAFTAPLVPLGAYLGLTTYREGNIVSLDDGSTWLYTATTPTAGNPPGPGSAYWFQYSAATGTTVATGVNQFVLSSFVRGLQGLRPGIRSALVTPNGSNGSPTAILNTGLNLNADYSGLRNVAYATYTDTLRGDGNNNDYIDVFWSPGPWGGDSLASGNGYMMPVKKGDRAYFRALLAPHRSIAQLFLLIFNKVGQLLNAPSVYGGRQGGGQFGDPANFGPPVEGLYDIVEDTAALAILMVRMIGNGGNNPYLFLTEPGMGVIPKTQTVLPPYSPGPNDPLADRTIENMAASFVNQGGLSTLDQATINELDRNTMTATTSGSVSGTYGGAGTPSIAYIPNLGADMAIKSGGSVYLTFTGNIAATTDATGSIYASFEILNAADNSVLASVRLPTPGFGPAGRLDNFVIRILNVWGGLTIRWRVATRATDRTWAIVQNPQCSVYWTAL